MDEAARSTAVRWLASAKGDLALARAAHRDDAAPARGVAFFVQQALEKGLKAVLVWDQVDFPLTHDLAVLAALVPPDWDLDLPVTELERLTDFAVDTRYPLDAAGDIRPVLDEEADAALAMVTMLVERIGERLAARGLAGPVVPE